MKEWFILQTANGTEANLDVGQDLGSLYQPKTWALVHKY